MMSAVRAPFRRLRFAIPGSAVLLALAVAVTPSLTYAQAQQPGGAASSTQPAAKPATKPAKPDGKAGNKPSAKPDPKAAQRPREPAPMPLLGQQISYPSLDTPGGSGDLAYGAYQRGYYVSAFNEALKERRPKGGRPPKDKRRESA